MGTALNLESIQEMLLEVWKEVLGVKVGPGDDFFDFGGDSIASVQVMYRISEQIGTEIPPTAIYAHPTIEDLAVQVELFLSEGTPAKAESTDGTSR